VVRATLSTPNAAGAATAPSIFTHLDTRSSLCDPPQTMVKTLLLKKHTQHALVHGTMEERENHQVYLTIVKPPGITKIPPFICCISMKNFLLIFYHANDTCSFVSFYWQQNF
jgi:hypothetical protein